jgi:hypothetical protein
MNFRERIMFGLVAAAAWTGLLIQADVSFTGMLGMGLTLSDAFIRFFSYFTVLTNSFIAIDTTVCLVIGESRWSRSAVHTSLATGLAVSIFFVSVCYTILLRKLLHLEGNALLANTILHYVVPALFLLYWVLFDSRHKLPWAHAGVWVMYPALYFLYALVQGWRTGLYPYPFIDAKYLGYEHALINGVTLLVLFWFGGFLFIGLGRALHRPMPAVGSGSGEATGST